MINTSSKVVRLSSETIKLIEEYKRDLINNTYKDNIRRYIEEMNYDSLIKAVFDDYLHG